MLTKILITIVRAITIIILTTIKTALLLMKKNKNNDNSNTMRIGPVTNCDFSWESTNRKCTKNSKNYIYKT